MKYYQELAVPVWKLQGIHVLLVEVILGAQSCHRANIVNGIDGNLQVHVESSHNDTYATRATHPSSFL